MNPQKQGILLEWVDDLSVGNEELDGHHKDMIRLINQLYDAVNNNPDRPVRMDVIEELMEYANYHFGAEEALFELKNFPYAGIHIEQHLEYREQVGQLRNLAEAGDDSAWSNLLEFLFTWWTRHIMEFDKKYAPYLRS